MPLKIHCNIKMQIFLQFFQVQRSQQTEEFQTADGTNVGATQNKKTL